MRFRSLAGIVLLLYAASVGGESPDETAEYTIKGAMVYGFTKFVTWPPESFADANAPLVLCVLGNDPFGPTFETFMRDKKYFGRPLRLRHIAAPPVDGCHVVFISRSEQKHLAEVLAAVTRPGVFTVSDIERFTERGGVIGMFTRADKVQFEINREAAQRVNLTISSKLLRLATDVGIGEFR